MTTGATNTIRIIGSEASSISNPPKSERIKAISQGWSEANEMRYSKAIPPPPNDTSNDFPIYDVKSLIRKEYRNEDTSNYFYGEYHFLYGIITKISKDMTEVQVHIVKSSESFKGYFSDIKDEDWTIYLDQTSWSEENEMSYSASMKLPDLMVPGRRLKFGMVEAFPGAGTSSNGVWSFIYLEGLKGNSF